ncbi:hypothetical protein [Desulfolutivibrio sp.]|uniref:hypothetical protein n=1 Tax=Desulfolutivibrio sp. TaxID=2773296 RepID=UPI002F968994
MLKAVFFIRHFNDLDHFTPVVHRMAVEADLSCDLCFFTPYYYNGDYRVKFLTSLPNVRLVDVRDFLPKPAPSAMGLIGGKEARAILDHCLEGAKKAVVALDWIMSLSDQVGGAYQAIVQEAHRRGLAAVCLPHGDSPQYNKLLYKDHYTYKQADIYGASAIFDHVATPNELCAARYRHHLPGHRLHVLGSPRYNDEWLSLLPGILPPLDKPLPEARLKIVFFLCHPEFVVFWEEVGRTLRLLAAIPGAHVLVAGHPRKVSYLDDFFAQLEREPELQSRFTFETNDRPSSLLIQWADLVLDMGTSINFETVLNRKPLIVMEYLHGMCSTIAHYMPEIAAHCRDHLLDACMAVLADDPPLPDPGNLARFKQDVVTCGDGDVLARYRDLLMRLLRDGCAAPPPEVEPVSHERAAGIDFPNDFYRDSFPGFVRMADMARRHGCRDILELGAGVTTLLFAELARDSGARVTSCDMSFDALKRYLPSPGHEELVRRHVRLIQGASVTAAQVRAVYEEPLKELADVPVAEFAPWLASQRRGTPRPWLKEPLERRGGGSYWSMHDIFLRGGAVEFHPDLLHIYAERGYQHMLNTLEDLETQGQAGSLALLDDSEGFDMIFFDSGELVSLVEWNILWRRIRPGGLAAFHDVFFPKSVKNFLICSSLLASPMWRLVFVEENTPQGLMIFAKGEGRTTCGKDAA